MRTDSQQGDQPDGDALSGEVHDAPPSGSLVAGPNGGMLNRGEHRPSDPTPNDLRASCRKRAYKALPGVERIAQNKLDKRRSKKPEGPYKVADQIRAFEALMRGASDDRISATDLRDACRGMAEDIRGFLPSEQAEALLAIVARRFVYL